MKTLYTSRKISAKSEISKFRVKTVFNKQVFFPFRVTFCCILFLFSYSTGIGQNAIVNTNKTAYFPGENIVITGSVWQPGEQVTVVISKINAPNESDTVLVTADSNGEILNTDYIVATTEDEAIYSLEASGETSLEAASTSFSNKLGLAQAHNGGIGDTPVSPVVWVNGNAHAQNSHYLEGNSIPYRVILGDVETGVHTIRLKWDIRHGGKNAIDFITSYDRSPAAGGINEIVDPLSDLPVGVFAEPKHFSIPTPAAALVVNGKAQPASAFLELPAEDRRMASFNATILNIVYLYQGNIADDNSTTEIEITYEVEDGPQFVIFAWGGHIANRVDWGPGSSAGAINGSPYHTALGISDYINGAQDRSLKADAVQFFPTCELTPIGSDCVGDTISVTATTNAPSPQFTWSATNGAIIIGSGATVQVVVPLSGPYTVSVSIVDFFEGQVISETTTCSEDGDVQVDPVVSVGPDQEQCLAIDGRDFEVSGSVSFGDFEWVVVSGDATIDDPDSLTTMVHLAANSNQAVLRLQAIGSCEDQSDDIMLTVNIEPEVDIVTDDDPDCQDSIGEYSVAIVAGHSYQWSISGDAQIDGSSTGSSVEVLVDNLCSVTFTLSVAVTDENGCVGYDTISVSFSDAVAPIIISGPGADATISCPSVPVFTAPTASDNCDELPDITTLPDVRVDGDCPQEYTLTRSWYFTDACGNQSATVSQTITVVDESAPVIVSGPGADATIACTATPVFTAPTATDNCDGAPAMTTLPDVRVDGACPQEFTLTRSWYFTDACGNQSATVSQTITVVDESAPVIISGPGADATIACTATPVFTAPTATDNCDGAPAMTTLPDVRVDGDCPQEYTLTRSWYFTDACGNQSATVSQTITVVDESAPVIVSGPGVDATISCPSVPVFTAPTATDNCDGAPVMTTLPDVRVDGACPQEYTLTRSWYFTDACGNQSATVSQTITVVDESAPVIVSGPGADATISCPSVPVFTAPTATDNCDGSPAMTTLPDVRVDGDCPQEYTLTRSWYFTDACGNQSATVSQTITVVDESAPVIVTGPGANATISCPSVPVFTAPTATDNCDGAPIRHQLADVRIDGDCPAEYSLTRSWYFTDACGNISATVSQTINVVDNVLPLLSEPVDTIIDCSEEPVFTAPIASDNCSSVQLIASGPDTTMVNDEMVLTMSWIAIDACGNQSIAVDQAITIRRCPEVFCSLTQGFYGNARGVACATGERGRDLMIRLLGPDFGPLVIGSAGRSLTINGSNVDCLIGDMPAGGPAAILPPGNASYGSNCNLPLGYTSNKGTNTKFKNVLLGQVITLGLNLRLDEDLANVQLEGTLMITYGAEPSTDDLCGTEDDTLIVEDILERTIPQSVLDALDAHYGGDRSIENLFLLANRMLGGELIAGVSLSNINQAVSAMNEGFDHCRFLGGFQDAREEAAETMELVSSDEINYKVFPNPFSESTTIEFVVDETMDVRIELYTINGVHVSTLYNEVAEGRLLHEVVVDGSKLSNGIYFCRIIANDQIFESRIILNK